MRCTILTAIFFALFALFSTMAYAAPVAPQGAILNRQCGMPECRDATGAPSTSPASGSADRFAMISNIITNLLSLMGNNGNTPSNGPQTSTTVTTAQSTSAAPASKPTGTPQYVPTIRWFSEIAVPSPTPSGA